MVTGVFNEAAISDRLWAEPATIIGRRLTLADIVRHCRLDADHTETLRFVGPRPPLEPLVDIFLGVETEKTRVGAAFVTASGKPSDPLQRLVTPWDGLGRSSS